MTESRRLTNVQWNYLDEMQYHNPLHQGWGGYGSTRTVRLLEERGYCILKYNANGHWSASLTNKGAQALDARREGEQGA